MNSKQVNITTKFPYPSLAEINQLGRLMDNNWGKPAFYKETVEQIYHSTRQYYNPQVLYSRVPILRFDSNYLLLKSNRGNIAIGNHMVSKFMEGAEALYLCAGSIGSEFDTFLSNLRDTNEMFPYIIADMIGNLLIGKVVHTFVTSLRQIAEERHEQVSWSLAPGESTWSLKDQKVIFNLLQLEQLHLSLSESMVISPSKSETFIMGWTSKTLQHPNYTRCRFCPRKGTCRFFNHVLSSNQLKL